MRNIFLIIFGLIATVMMSGPAHAYLDPGTGSMILQLLLGGIAGAMVVGRLYWQRIKEILGLAPKVVEENTQERTEEEQG